MSYRLLCAALAAVGLAAAPVQADDTGVSVFLDPEVYVAAGLGFSSMNVDSGGLNTVGPHLNSGSDDVSDMIVSGAVGLANFASIGPVSFRIEGEMFHVKASSLRTDSFPGPPGPIAFFYNGTMEQSGGMVSVWADYQPMETLPLILSAGGGFGVARTWVNANDGVVRINGQDDSFLYMGGLQAAWNFDENWTLALTGRYIGMQSVEYQMRTLGGGAPAGNYTLDPSGFQGMATVRLRFPI